MGLSKTPRHSALQSRRTLSQIQCVISGDLASSRGRIMRLYAGRTRFTHCMHYLIAFCSRPEAASDKISDKFVRPTLLDKHAKFRDHHLNRSPEIRPEVVGGGIVHRFFGNFHKCRPEVAGDVRSGLTVESVGMNVLAKCGDSRLNYSTISSTGPVMRTVVQYLIEFAVDRKKLMMSCPAFFWRGLSTISV